ncbi:hypothetical protein FA15DRAFT_662013, partial [Coprinopsis marcescibilis]
VPHIQGASTVKTVILWACKFCRKRKACRVLDEEDATCKKRPVDLACKFCRQRQIACVVTAKAEACQCEFPPQSYRGLKGKAKRGDYYYPSVGHFPPLLNTVTHYTRTVWLRYGDQLSENVNVRNYKAYMIIGSNRSESQHSLVSFSCSMAFTTTMRRPRSILHPDKNPITITEPHFIWTSLNDEEWIKKSLYLQLSDSRKRSQRSILKRKHVARDSRADPDTSTATRHHPDCKESSASKSDWRVRAIYSSPKNVLRAFIVSQDLYGTSSSDNKQVKEIKAVVWIPQWGPGTFGLDQYAGVGALTLSPINMSTQAKIMADHPGWVSPSIGIAASFSPGSVPSLVDCRWI